MQGAQVDLFVAPYRFPDLVFGLDEGGRIKDDNVLLASIQAELLESFEGVNATDLMEIRGDSV